MKKSFIFLILLAFPITGIFAKLPEKTQNYLTELDGLLKNLDKYESSKIQKIDQYKELIKISSNAEQKFDIQMELFQEYFYYQKDSSLIYAKKCLATARNLQDEKKINLATLNLSEIYGTSGLFKEALDVMGKVNLIKYPELKEYYYSIMNVIYNHMAYYAVSSQDKEQYIELYKNSLDSLILFSSDSTKVYNQMFFGVFSFKLPPQQAIDTMIHYEAKITNIHDMAVISNNISEAFQSLGNEEEEIYWLAKSAINDLKSVTKEYVSLRNLAVLLYKNGEINRAYNYISQSMKDALFCNARLRTYEISKNMPLIDSAYRHQEEEKQKIFERGTIIIGILFIILLFTIWRVYRQMRKLKIARAELSEVNEKLAGLNSKLVGSNKLLEESNTIKEEYIAKYMDQCSIYINKIDEFRRNLQKTATTGKMEDLLLKIKSKDFIDDVLEDFYHNFDHTFIQLFPGFVTEFNELLLEEHRISLKAGQILNTELRMFALIRLGINDSIKISEFLRCSPNTIYNYRTRNRNNAIGNRNDFEEKVMNLCIN